MISIQTARAAYAPITKNQPGKSAGIAEQDLPQVRIHDYTESGQAGGF
jgi:hypothetical protein